jgi:hypothetical protein
MATFSFNFGGSVWAGGEGTAVVFVGYGRTLLPANHIQGVKHHETIPLPFDFYQLISIRRFSSHDQSHVA